MADDYIRVPIADIVAIGDDPITGWAYVQLLKGYWRGRRDGPPHLPGPEAVPRKSRDRLVAIERLRLVAGGRYVIPAQEAYDQKVRTQNARPRGPKGRVISPKDAPVGSPSGEPEWGGLAEHPGAPVGSPSLGPLVKSESESESEEWEHVLEGEEGQTAVLGRDGWWEPDPVKRPGYMVNRITAEWDQLEPDPVEPGPPCQGCGRTPHPGKTCAA